MNETNILIIPIAVIVATFLVKWLCDFVRMMRYENEIKANDLREQYFLESREMLNRIYYTQTMEDKYHD